MPGLYLVSGNRLELLAERCASFFRDEPFPPMTKEIIVLQSLGMMQWLSIQLAGKLGIWADFEYVLPNRMTGILMKSFFPGMGDERFFEKDIMTWKTMKVLRDSTGVPVYSELHDYLNGDSAGIKEYQVASRITDLFDQYMTFRPDMINRWDSGEIFHEEGWQPHLWRALTSGMNSGHPPAFHKRLFELIASDGITPPDDFPRRISLFGISYLPLYHLDVLIAASRFCDIYLYMLNPCREYWFDVMREKEITSLVLKNSAVTPQFEDDLHIERGNPLLSSMGRSGRDFFRFLYMSNIDAGDEHLFEEPAGDSILAILQRDILTMTERGKSIESPAVKLDSKAASEDDSIVINSCHSVMREVEVLHDYLLSLFDNGSGIAPGDVLVMAPDIESFSSIIQGVFDRREDGVPRIPYRIADRTPGKTSRVVDTMMKILSLNEGRFTSAEVMGILQCPEVLRKFELTGDDFDSIGLWVRETGIFWGIDSGYKEERDLPGIHENTWSFGLERMFLGSVMMCGDETVKDILPYPVIEGNSSQVLGRFITFFKLLRDTYYKLNEKHSPAEWGGIINDIADQFFESGPDSQDEILLIIKTAARLKETEERSGFSGETGLLPVREFIEQNLSAASAGRNFITGSLTFCGMLPMRSIPRRVICLIGMNEYSFPRKSRPSGFDLMMIKPRMGDRSVRDEDRFLFLETVISAREKLYISYTGQNITTNTDQNPSIVVSELIECIEQSFSVEGEKKIKDIIVRRQRIQPYHPVYFKEGSGYYSYSAGMRSGAQSYVKRDAGQYDFLAEKLPPLTADERDISIEMLAEFLSNPARYLIKRRLGVNLQIYTDDYIEEESFKPGSLELYNTDERIFSYLAGGVVRDDIYKKIRAEGILPHGTPGEIFYNESLKKADRLYEKVAPLLTGISRMECGVEINGFRITGAYTLYGGKQVFYRTGSLRAKDRLRAWVYHLAVCCGSSVGPDFSTVSVTLDKSAGYRVPDNCREILASLLEIYESGMTQPLPLFPYSSYQYAVSIIEEDEDKAFREAMKLYRASRGLSDLADEYVYKLFGGNYEPGDEFIRASMAVYGPLIEHEAEGE